MSKSLRKTNPPKCQCPSLMMFMQLLTLLEDWNCDNYQIISYEDDPFGLRTYTINKTKGNLIIGQFNVWDEI